MVSLAVLHICQWHVLVALGALGAEATELRNNELEDAGASDFLRVFVSSW
jgi:hypothetical protein